MRFYIAGYMDTAQRLKASWAGHAVSADELRAILPRSGDRHQEHVTWFAEYVIQIDKNELLSSSFYDEVDNPDFESRYLGLLSDLPSSFDLKEVMKHSSLLQLDYDHVSGALERQHHRPADGPWRLGYYDVKRLIGEGSNAKVYLAHDNRSDCDVALKVPKHTPNRLQPGRIRSVITLSSEARNSKNLPPLEGLVKTHQVHYPSITPDMSDEEIVAGLRLHLLREPIAITMDYVEGISLRQRLESTRDRRLDTFEVATIMDKILRTLQFLHQAGVVHRDLKPENIILREDGQPVLCDLGLAVAMTEINKDDSFLRGTPLYFSPEQTIKGQQATTSSDIWSLGIIMYEASTGKHPFIYLGDVNIRDESLRRIRDVAAESLRTLNPSIDAEFEEICLKCLEKDPRQRHSSARALQEAVLEWQSRHWQSDTQGSKRALPTNQYAWNPEIYATLLEKATAFILIEVVRFSKDTYGRIQELLRKYGCISYRIYEVFGSTDIVVRGYFTLKQLSDGRSPISIAIGGGVILEENLIGSSKTEALAWASV